MRIVHDVTTPMQVSCGAKPYFCGPGKQGFHSAQIDLLMVESPAGNHPELPEQMFGRHEAIYIEGDAKYIIEMLERALAVIRMTTDHMREELGEERSTNCPDGCAEIVNGTHEVTCPRHANYEYFKSQEAK